MANPHHFFWRSRARRFRSVVASARLAAAATAAAGMLVLFPTLVSGEPAPVELELVLAIDTSVSVDSWEYRLQTGGLAAAFSTYVDKDGNISLPADFRKNMGHLGSWFVPEGEASGFHDVYSKPIIVEAYRAAFAVG